MEPRVFTRGNRIASALGPWRGRCFNGATRLHAWKLHLTEGGDTSYRNASMEPRVFTRGNAASATEEERAMATLQWSHASSRVETRYMTQGNAIRLGLQWSHASSRVETSVPSLSP